LSGPPIAAAPQRGSPNCTRRRSAADKKTIRARAHCVALPNRFDSFFSLSLPFGSLRRSVPRTRSHSPMLSLRCAAALRVFSQTGRSVELRPSDPTLPPAAHWSALSRSHTRAFCVSLFFFFSFFPPLSFAGPPLSERSSPPHGLISISDARSARPCARRAAGPAAPADCRQLRSPSAHRRAVVLSLRCPCHCVPALQAQLCVGEPPGEPPGEPARRQPPPLWLQWPLRLRPMDPAVIRRRRRQRDRSVSFAPAAVAAVVTAPPAAPPAPLAFALPFALLCSPGCLLFLCPFLVLFLFPLP